MSTISPNMNLILSTVNVDSGLSWENNLNSSLNIIDAHNHAAGNGVQIPTAGININSGLSFNNYQATGLQAATFIQQSSIATLTSLYVKADGNLYYNDSASNVIQFTSGGLVNATSSGISSGTASAAFSTGVLIVNAATNTPANIQGGSLLLGNNIASSHFLTLAPPGSMAANYQLTLPTVPGSQSFVSIDSSGNLAPYTPVSGGILGGMIAAGTILGPNLGSNVNLAGNAVQENGKNVVVSQTNAASSLGIIRGQVSSSAPITIGEGFTVSLTSTGIYAIAFLPSFASAPIVTACIVYPGGTNGLWIQTDTPTTFGVNVYTSNGSGLSNSAFSFIVIGPRA